MFYRGLLILTISFFLTAETQSQTRLEPRVAVEYELSGGQKQIYQFSLSKGEYAHVVVIQRGVDARLRLIGTDGNLIAEFDSDLRLNGEESAEVIADTTGDYKLEVESKNKPDSSGRYGIQLTESRTATDKDRALDDARKLLRQVNGLLDDDKPSEALPLAEQALAIREEQLGPDHPEVASAINVLANVANDMEDYSKAETLFDRAVSIREKSLPADHPDLAESLCGLARVYHMQGKYSQASELFQRALEIKEQVFGPDHPEVGALINMIAKHYQYIHDNVHAEMLFQRALSIAEKSFGKTDPKYAKSLSNLAIIYSDMADYNKAKAMYQQAMEILEKCCGADDPRIFSTLINYGVLYVDIGEYQQAESFFQRALKILENREKDDFSLAIVLSNLGHAYLGESEYTKAQPAFEQALALRQKLFGADHPRDASSLLDLANLYRAQNDFDKAVDFYKRALEIFEKAYGSDHPDVLEPLQALSMLARARGDINQSIELQSRANNVAEQNLNYNLVLGSEREKLNYLASISDQTDSTISLHINSALDNADARALAATAVLQRKGRVLDWMTDSLTTLRNRFSAEDKKEIDQLNETNSRLANLVLDGPPEKVSVAVYQKEIRSLEESKEKIEDQISHTSAGFYQHQEPVTLTKIQSTIPADAVLIEFAIYHPLDPKISDTKKAYSQPRYVAFVIGPKNEIGSKELGDVNTIDAEINAFREALRDPQSQNVKQLARKLDTRILQPIRPLIHSATHLLISPDGSMNLIPFEALVDEQSQYLVQDFQFTYLTSGRDLLRLQVARENKTGPLILANPIFGEPESIAMANTRGVHTIANNATKRRSITTGSDLSEIYFAPLSGTANEAQAIKLLFKDAKVWTGIDATETLLKQISAPQILHIATHGFFLSDVPVSSNPSAEKTRSINASAKIENPLLRSGLALSGANLPKHGTDDGILTALEASGLNLWGTKLVTLSACDTGIGEVKNGEGVYGLRRAFVLAGTESLVMSLWGVNDYVTRELMTNYYKGLKNGLGRGEALRQVQLSMIQNKSRQHPYYWASFIQSGEWANLNGER